MPDSGPAKLLRPRHAWTVVPCVLALLARGGIAIAQVAAAHGRPPPALVQWCKGVDAAGYRVIYINGCDVGGSPLLAGVAVKDRQPPPFILFEMSLEGYRKKDAELKAQNFHAICFSGYLNGNARACRRLVRDRQPTPYSRQAPT